MVLLHYVSESCCLSGFKNKQNLVIISREKAFNSDSTQKYYYKHTNPPNCKRAFYAVFKNLISFPLNLSSQGKSPIPARNLINKVNKVLV